MKKVKPSCEMMSSTSSKSLAVHHTGIFEDGKELVVTVGYHKDMTFGYFICWEQFTANGFVYTDQLAYKQKVNEKTYQDILRDLSSLVKSQADAAQ